MNFVHLESREGCPFHLGQIKRLARREGGDPITRADVVIGAGLEFPSWGQESVNRPDGGPILLPAKNERLVIRVTKAAPPLIGPTASEVRELLLISRVAVSESLAPPKIAF